MATSSTNTIHSKIAHQLPTSFDGKQSTTNINLAANNVQAQQPRESNSINGQPVEQLQVEEPNEDNIEYTSGPQLWLNLTSVLLVCFLHGLDLTIVAVTVPSLTNQFKTLDDIGWYSAIYGLFYSALSIFFGRMYTLFGLKKLYVISVIIFEIGSIICTFAPTSKVFILGRAIAGIGAAGQGAGGMVFIPRNFPVHKRPIMNGLFGLAQSIGLVGAPVIGGVLIDTFTWRACFGINVPIGVIAILITGVWMQDPYPNPNLDLPFRTKIKRTDPVGTLLIVPSVVCLMIALQWGGIRYGWADWRIILLFVLFAVLLGGFGWVQRRQGDKAILPPRIIKNRTALGSALFGICTNGLLAVTEYYIAIYFQGVRGYSATKAGLLGLPMIGGLAVASIAAAFGTTWIGYYTPFMYATSVLAPIASGLLTTIDLDDSSAKVAALLGFIGVAVGVGNQGPVTATMTGFSPKDVSMALGVVMFGGGLGSALFVAVSASLFQDRLTEEIAQHAPGTNTSSIKDSGLADFRDSIGSDRLKEVLTGYNEAVIQTLYIPLALALLTIVASATIPIRSVKKKRI